MVLARILVATSLVVAVAVAAQNEVPQTALFDAIQRGASADAERLLGRGANANAVSDEGIPAVMAATLFGDAAMVESFLTHGADPNKAGPDGTTALMWAVPDVGKVRALLAHGANVNAKSDSRRTALLVASNLPRTVEILSLLLDKGADLRPDSGNPMTALAMAIRSADMDVVKLLVGRGLDPKALAPNAARIGLARWDRPTAEYLLAQGVDVPKDLLLNVANWQPTELVTRWIDAGADVNATNTNQYNRTPLLTAVASDAAPSGATVKLLLERGADPNVAMTEGDSPLDFAMYKGDRVKIQALEQYGAKRGNGPRREEIAPPPKAAIGEPRLAVAKGAARLLDVAPNFRQQTRCISCHHNTLPSLAAAVVVQKGIEVDSSHASKALDDLSGFYKASLSRMMLGDAAVGGESLVTGYALVALAASHYPADATVAAMTHWLIARQLPDGRWLGNGLNRPPSEYSAISHTAMAAGGLKAYAFAGMKKETAETLVRARQWLTAAQPASAEERAMRLMGLVWTDASSSLVAAALKAVREQQDAGGGWSQFGRTAPDAYATGISLYALHVAGVPTSDAAYRKGVAFLLNTQYPDGTWLVKSHTFPVQRYFESGFPFGRHQWISAAGTGWATIAIAQTLADAKRASIETVPSLVPALTRPSH